MSNEPKQLYDDNPKVKPSEKLPKIRSFGEGAVDEFTRTEVGHLSEQNRRPYTDESTGLKVYPGTTYSKTPEEFNNEIEDLKDQRKRWEAGLELSAKKNKILSEIQELNKSNPSSQEDLNNLANYKQQLENQSALLDKQLLEVAPKGYDKEPLSTEEKISQPFSDAITVFNNFLKSGDVWGLVNPALPIFTHKDLPKFAEDKDALDRIMNTPGAFFKGFNQMLGGGFQSIAILGHAWDKMFGNNYDLEDNPTFKLGKYISELGVGIEDPNYLHQLFQAQGSMAGFLLGGEILAPIKAAIPTSTLWSQIFSTGGRIAAVGGLTQFPDEYLKALKMGASQSQATWIGALNFIGGMTEALPIQAFLEKLTASTGQKFLWQKALKDASIQGTEEGLQETFQQLLANASAQQIYDANRELLQGVFDGGAIGFLSGMLMSGSIGMKQVVQEMKSNKEYSDNFNELVDKAYLYAKTSSAQTSLDILKNLRGSKVTSENQKELVDKLNEAINIANDKSKKSTLIKDVIFNPNFSYLFDNNFDYKISRPSKEQIRDMTPDQLEQYAKYIISKHNDYISSSELGGTVVGDVDRESIDEIEKRYVPQTVAEQKNRKNLKELDKKQLEKRYEDLVEELRQMSIDDYERNREAILIRNASDNDLILRSLAYKLPSGEVLEGNPSWTHNELLENYIVHHPELGIKLEYSDDDIIRYDLNPLVGGTPGYVDNKGNFHERNSVGESSILPLLDEQSEYGDYGSRIIKDFYKSKENYFYNKEALKENYEVSTQGDKRFSALVAKLEDGRTIEEAYQLDIKGYRSKGNDWKLGKGKPPIVSISKEEQYQKYKELWKTYLNENPDLFNELKQIVQTKTLTDKFAKTEINQARALTEIVNESNQQAPNKLDFQEEQTTGYRNRTIKNASADATIALATDFNSAGEKLTKSSVISQNKKYIPIDANVLEVTDERVNKIVDSLNSVHAKSLNIAGNGIYTMKGKYSQSQVDEFTYQLLKRVLESPNLKTKIESIRTGGQTGFDEAGAKASQRLGIPTTILAPKGWTFRNEQGKDISNEREFKSRFINELTTPQSDEVKSINESLDEVNTFSSNPMLRTLANAYKGRVNEKLTFTTLDVFGDIDPQTKEIRINKNISGEDKYESVIHEVTHRFTINGIYLDNEFKGKIQNIYDTVKGQMTLPDNISGMGSDEQKLVEFVGYAFSDKDFQGQLAKIQVGKTGKTAWREFVNAVWTYLGKILGLKGNEFSESALNNIIVAVSEHVDKNFPVEQANQTIQEIKEQTQQSNLLELTAPIETVLSDSVPRTYDQTSGVDSKFEAMDETDDDEIWSGMSTSQITSEFVNKDGKQIYESADKMYADMLDIYKMARNQEKEATDNLGIDERALQIFKDKYQDIALEKETKENAFSFLENVFYSMKNKRVHKIATLEINHSGKIQLVNHEKVYPTGIRKQSSVIYDKRFYELIAEQVNEVINKGKPKEQQKKIEIHELKNYNDFIDKINKDRAEAAKALGEYSYVEYKMRDVMEEVYKKGFALMPNKNEVLLVKVQSILSNEEIAQILDTKQNIFDGVKISTAIFNKFWGTAFNPNDNYEPISQAALLKRMANLAGKAPNNLITPDLKKHIGTNERAPMYLDGNKVIVKTVQLDAKTLNPELLKYLKETLGDWNKPELIGDGAIFSLPEVHDFENLMNGVPYDKWGRLNKYKTFGVGEQLLKCADQKAFNFSPIHEWMRWNNIGKIVVSSARKIKYGQESITWNTILGEKQEDGSIKKVPVKDSQVYKYDMRQDAFQSSHGEVKTESKGLMSSFVTTMLSSYMSPEMRQILQKHLKGHVNILKTQTLDKLDSLDFVKQGLIKFMKDQEDLFESFEQQWIQSEIKKDSKFSSVLTSIEYFKQNVLSKRIQNTLQHEEINGSLPALVADMGELGGYKKYFIKQYLKKNSEATQEEAETEASTYFDKYGFIKKGYCVIDEVTYKRLGEPENLIIGCNPPASIADIRAIKVALVIPTDSFEGHRVSASALSVNIKQFQAISGKDFDIDKVPVVNPKSSEMKSLWEFLHKLDPDSKLEKLAKDFETWNLNDKFKEPENRIDALEKLVNIPALKGKIDGPLAHVIKLFGVNKTLNNLDITNPEHFAEISDRLSDNFIGRLYNVRLIYTAMLEKGGSVTYNTFDNKGNAVVVEVSTNMKKVSYNTALLYYLTNYSLDWLSDQKILSFNYDPALLNHILYNIKVDGKESQNALVTNKYVQKMYETYLKPSRMLLRRPDNPDVKIKSYAELKSQLLDAYNTLYEGKMDSKENIFDGTTVIQAARDFLTTFMDSKVGAMGLQPTDVLKMYSNLKRELVPTGDLLNEEKQLIKFKSSMSHLGKLMNRFRDISTFTPKFVLETKEAGKSFANNSEGGLAEIHFYSKSLRDANIMPSTHNLFNELLNDYFEKDLMITRKSGQDLRMVIPSSGTTLQRSYIIESNSRNEISYIIEERQKGKLINSTRYNSWTEMLKNQGSFPIFEIINKLGPDAVKSMVESFGKIFIIAGNSRLKNYVSDRMFDIYKNVASEMNSASKVGQRLFFKLGLGIYDSSQWTPYKEETDEMTKYGERYRLSIFQDSNSITHLDNRQNIKIPNIAPYMLYLQKASEVNEVAKDLYEEILGSVIKTALSQRQDKLDQMSNGKMLPFYFFHKPLVIESVAPKDALVSKQSEIQAVAKSIMSNLPKSVRDWQVIQFWNSNNQQTKVSKNNLTEKHYQFYIDNMVRSYFNLEPIYRGSKKYNAQLDTYKMLEKVTADPEGKYNSVSQFFGRLMPSQFMIRAFSDRNINLMPNEKIIYIHNGTFHYISPFDIVSSFGETSARIDTNQIVSGSMIAQEITRKLNNGFNDNQQIYESNMDKLRAIWTEDNAFLHEQQEANWWEGFGFKEKMADIAEGTDENKVLKGMNFGFPEITYKDIKYKIATISNKDGMTVDFNIKDLTSLARNILTDKELLTDKGKTIFNNNYNAIQIRLTMGAIAQRWLYDYYAEIQIQKHITDLTFLSKYVNRLSSPTILESQALIRDFLNKSKNMLKQIELMKNQMRSQNKFYMPHMFSSEEMFKRALTDFFIKKRVPDVTKAVEAELSKSADEANYMGNVKENITHLNFLERKFGTLGYYRKDENVAQDYFSTLNLMFRQRMLTVYEEINKEWLVEDNKFMNDELRWQSAILKTQNAVYRSVQNINQLDKRDFISFRKSKTYDIVYGEVVSINKSNNTFVIKELTGDTNVTYKYNEVANLRVMSGIVASKQLKMFCYKMFGKDYSFEQVDTTFRMIVSLRNKSLLGIKFYYALRNRFGENQMVKAMYGTKESLNTKTKTQESYFSLAEKELDKLQALGTIESIENESSIKDQEKEVWKLLLNEATAFFGGVNQIMGRIGFTADVTSAVDKDFSEYLIQSNQQWQNVKLELEPLLKIINGSKSDIGWDERKFIDARNLFVRKVFTKGGFMRNFYNKYHLDSPITLLNKFFGKGTYNVSPKKAEELNRKTTILTAVMAFADVFDLTEFTQEEQKMMKPIILELSKTVYEQGIKLVDFLYQPGLDLSHYDSTMGGHTLLQFSHFGNSLTSTYIDRWIQASKQMKMFGTATVLRVMKNDELWYEARLLNPVTGEVKLYHFKEFNALRQALSMTWRSFIFGIIDLISVAFTKEVIGYGAGSVAGTLFQYLFINAIGDGIGISLIKGLTNGLMYLIQASVNQMPSDPEDKELDKVNKILGIIAGYSEDEYVAWEVKKIKANEPGFYQLGKTEEMLRRSYQRRKARTYVEGIPIMGVGLGDLYTLLMSAFISEGEFDNAMELAQSTLTTIVPGMSIVVPIIQSIKPDFAWRSDPYYSAKSDYKASHKDDLKLIKEAVDKINKTRDTSILPIAEKSTYFKSSSAKEMIQKMQNFRSLLSFDDDEGQKSLDRVQELQGLYTGTAQEKDFNTIVGFLTDSDVREVLPTDEYNAILEGFNKVYEIDSTMQIPPKSIEEEQLNYDEPDSTSNYDLSPKERDAVLKFVPNTKMGPKVTEPPSDRVKKRIEKVENAPNALDLLPKRVKKFMSEGRQYERTPQPEEETDETGLGETAKEYIQEP
jgi:hypothetical protein